MAERLARNSSWDPETQNVTVLSNSLTQPSAWCWAVCSARDTRSPGGRQHHPKSRAVAPVFVTSSFYTCGAPDRSPEGRRYRLGAQKQGHAYFLSQTAEGSPARPRMSLPQQLLSTCAALRGPGAGRGWQSCCNSGNKHQTTMHTSSTGKEGCEGGVSVTLRAPRRAKAL